MSLGAYADLGIYGAQQAVASFSVTINSVRTSKTRPTITGTVSIDGATVVLQVASGTEYQAVVSGNSWYIKLGAMSVGAYTITATASDGEGGAPASASSSLVIIPPILGDNESTGEFAGISNLVFVGIQGDTA
jgi:hypothetical protein